MAPLPAAAPPGSSLAPIPSCPPSVAVSGLPPPPATPAVLASSSDADSSISSPLHLVLSAALSYVPVLPPQYSPPVPSSCAPTRRSSVVLPLPLAAVSVISIASVIPLVAPALPRFVPLPSLVLLPALPPPPPPSLRVLRLPAPPRAPPPLALSPDIARKDKYFGYRTGGDEARWPTAGRSAPRGKCPNRPIAMVGDGISRPLFLHLPQQ